MIKIRASRFLSWNLDFLGFSVSVLCAIHCLALPFLLSLGLFGGLNCLHHPLVEWGLIGTTVLVASPALYRGYLQHSHVRPVWIAGAGFLLLGFSRLSIADEHLLTAAGGLLIATAHWFNWKYGKGKARPQLQPEVHMKKQITILLLSLLWSCSAPDQQSDLPQGDTIIDEAILIKNEPDLEILPPLDSSIYSWDEGYLVLPWSVLTRVEFNWAYSEIVDQEVPFPVFTSELKALDGQQVQVSGYAIPLEETGDETFVILSAFPYSQCFFCGQAGPESVIDILPGHKLPRLSVDKKTTFRGRLRLNDDDLRYLNYMLEEAELIE